MHLLYKYVCAVHTTQVYIKQNMYSHHTSVPHLCAVLPEDEPSLALLCSLLSTPEEVQVVDMAPGEGNVIFSHSVASGLEHSLHCQHLISEELVWVRLEGGREGGEGGREQGKEREREWEQGREGGKEGREGGKEGREQGREEGSERGREGEEKKGVTEGGREGRRGRK